MITVYIRHKINDIRCLPLKKGLPLAGKDDTSASHTAQ